MFDARPPTDILILIARFHLVKTWLISMYIYMYNIHSIYLPLISRNLDNMNKSIFTYKRIKALILALMLISGCYMLFYVHIVYITWRTGQDLYQLLPIVNAGGTLNCIHPHVSCPLYHCAMDATCLSTDIPQLFNLKHHSVMFDLNADLEHSMTFDLPEYVK